MSYEKLFHELKFDPINEIEKKYGLSHHSEFNESQGLEMLGLALAQGRAKEEVLKANHDTHFSMTYDEYVQVITGLGFELACEFEIPYKSVYDPTDRPPRMERFTVYGQRKYGIVLYFDSYTSLEDDGSVHKVTVNGGNWYATFKPNERRNTAHLSSGGWESPSQPNWRNEVDAIKDHPQDLVWFGHWDCREGVWANISSLLENGELLPQWPKMRKPYLPLFTSHYDYYSPEYELLKQSQGRGACSKYIDELNLERSKQAPQWLRDIINNVRGE